MRSSAFSRRSMLVNFPRRRSADSSATGRVIGFSCIADLSPAGSPTPARKPPPDEHLSDRGFAALLFLEPRAGRRREQQIFAPFQDGFPAPQQASPTRSSYPPPIISFRPLLPPPSYRSGGERSSICV